MATPGRSRALTIFAILFVLLAVSNFLKPFQFGGEEHTGFVLFGKRTTGATNMLVGPLFGLYLLLYAYGIWSMRRWALPMGVAYMLYVMLNMILFPIRTPQPPGVGYQIFGLIYAAVAIGVTGSAVWQLGRRRAELQ
jgi:hypothetical protein